MDFIKRIRFEPAVVSALVVAALIFFGATEEVAQAAGADASGVVEAINAILVIGAGYFTRAKVTPVAKLVERGGLPGDVRTP